MRNLRVLLSVLAYGISSISGKPLPEKRVPQENLPPWNLWPDDGMIKLLSHSGTGCPTGNSDSVFLNHMSRTPVYDYAYDAAINYWHIGLLSTIDPKAGPGIDKSESYKVCETEWSYEAFYNYTGQGHVDYNGPLKPRLHINATLIESRYKLADGAIATWKVTYIIPEQKDIIDSVQFKGPLDTSNTSISYGYPPTYTGYMNPSTPDQGRDLPCGKGTFKVKTEVSIESSLGGESVVIPAEPTPTTQWSRHLLGVSFDYRTCSSY